MFAFECIHDLPDPVGVLAAMRRLAGDAGAVVVMDERVAETFTAPGDDVERLMYGYSLMCCLADGMAHQPSAGTGTVMRPSTLRRYAVEAGFADVEILDIANDFFRFYRLRCRPPRTRGRGSPGVTRGTRPRDRRAQDPRRPRRPR